MKGWFTQAVALVVLLIVIVVIGDAVFGEDISAKRSVWGRDGTEFYVPCGVWASAVMSAKRTGWQRYLDIVKRNVAGRRYETAIAIDAAGFASISDDITRQGALLYCREESKRYWDGKLDVII